jgi:hypothetical protein
VSFWRLIGFEEALDRWIATEHPSTDLRFVVTEWIIGRGDDAYVGVRRRVDVGGNYWFGIVPGSREGERVAVCGYWIDEENRSVRCDAIATLDGPIT